MEEPATGSGLPGTEDTCLLLGTVPLAPGAEAGTGAERWTWATQGTDLSGTDTETRSGNERSISGYHWTRSYNFHFGAVPTPKESDGSNSSDAWEPALLTQGMSCSYAAFSSGQQHPRSKVPTAQVQSHCLHASSRVRKRWLEQTLVPQLQGLCPGWIAVKHDTQHRRGQSNSPRPFFQNQGSGIQPRNSQFGYVMPWGLTKGCQN